MMNEEKRHKLATKYLRQPREQAPHGLRPTPWVRNLLMGFIEFLEENGHMETEG